MESEYAPEQNPVRNVYVYEHDDPDMIRIRSRDGVKDFNIFLIPTDPRDREFARREYSLTIGRYDERSNRLDTVLFDGMSEENPPRYKFKYRSVAERAEDES